MEKNTVLEEEIIFFDAEIEEDDDDAPVGTLFIRQENVVASEEVPKAEDDPVPVEEPTPVIAEESAPQPEPVVILPVQETEPAPEPVAPVETPAPQKAKQTPAPKAKVTLTEQEPTAKKSVVNDSFSGGKVDMSYDYQIDLTPAPKKPAKSTEAKTKTAPKTTAPKKVEETDPWGTAKIKTSKAKSAPKAVEEKPAEKSAPKKVTKKSVPIVVEESPVEELPAPAPKATKKATAPKNDANKVDIKTNEEENKVAKEATKAATPEVKEQVLVEGEGKIHGKFVIKKTDKGHFVYKLYSSNHRVVAIGAQAYEGLSGCKGGINSVMRIAESAHVENQTLKTYETLKFPKWEIYTDKKGEFRLRLYASNGQLVATTNDGYLNVASAKKGIEAVARAAAGAAIVRNDDLW